jgi:DNA-binding transcriptional ArsR family regulator
MAQYSSTLDGVFQAVSDPTRRAVLGRLGAGPASIGELAAPFDMALPSFMKHIGSLEKAGLIRTQKAGRVRICTLERDSFDLIEGWLSEQRGIWAGRTDRLEQFVTAAPDRHRDKETPA